MLCHTPTPANKNLERRVKVFKNGSNRAVRIPREFEFPGGEAIMRKEGDRLIIEPAPAKSLLAVLATLKPLREDFPPVIDLRPDPINL
jgi:antitoxin VapB